MRATLSIQDRQRFKDFERIVEDTSEVFALPEVQGYAADLGVDLAAINERVFMPNIRFGVYYIPKSYKDTEAIPLIPLLYQGEKVSASRSALGLTPAHRRLFDKTLASLAYQPLGKDRNLLCRGARRRARAPKGLTDSYAAVNAAKIEKNGIRGVTRPIIFIGKSILKNNPESVSAAAAHEYVHAYDFNTNVVSSSGIGWKRLKAYSELRAHYLTNMIQDLAGIDDDVYKVSSEVERMRKSIGLEFPFGTTDIPPMFPRQLALDGFM